MYGIDLEIANAYANSRGLELIVRNIEFENILSDVAAGKADIGMAGITVTDERKQICDFTTTYYKSSQKLVVDGKNTEHIGPEGTLQRSVSRFSLPGVFFREWPV